WKSGHRAWTPQSRSMARVLHTGAPECIEDARACRPRLTSGESLPPEVGRFLATIRGRLRRRMNTASLDLVVNDEACAWARGQNSFAPDTSTISLYLASSRCTISANSAGVFGSMSEP